MKKKKITKKWLEEKDACKKAVKKFEKENMEGMDVWRIIEILRDQKNYKDYIYWLFENCKLTGICEGWWSNGQLRYKWNYVNGQYHGLSEGWYDNGQLYYKHNYVKSQIHGVCEWWYKNGQLWYKKNYVNGELVD